MYIDLSTRRRDGGQCRDQPFPNFDQTVKFRILVWSIPHIYIYHSSSFVDPRSLNNADWGPSRGVFIVEAGGGGQLGRCPHNLKNDKD